MRLKPGKICNSLKSISPTACLQRLCSCCCICASRSSMSSNSGGTNKPTLKKELKLIYYTFLYNHHNDSLTALETVLYPLVDMMTSFVKILGWFLVSFVWVLLLNMLYVFLEIILPKIYHTTSGWTFLVHFLLGVWLGSNTFFHYSMGTITSPGEPPKDLVNNVVTICKKCVTPKPPRTHHCSVCGKCVLKMDHHCPWFNNCIGFYNHRYFFMFCVFIILDCIYLSTIGFHYYQLVVYPEQDLNIFSMFVTQAHISSEFESTQTYHTLTTVEFFIIFIAGFAVFGLAAINAFIISQGATNIEVRSLRIPCVRSTYSNPRSPYDAGFVNNWKIFLGFSDIKVILPSPHKPLGDGIDWSEYYEYSRSFDKNRDMFIV